MSDTSRLRILDAATHLFAHQGYGSTSVREVVERAGVTKPTLYYWFENKEALYRQCIRAQFAELAVLVGEAVNSSDPIRERLLRFVGAIVEKGLKNVDGVRLAVIATHPSFERRPEVDVLSFHLEYVSPLEDLVAQGVAAGELRADMDPRFAVTALLGTVTTHLKATLDGHELPPDYPEQILDLFLNGAGTR